MITLTIFFFNQYIYLIMYYLGLEEQMKYKKMQINDGEALGYNTRLEKQNVFFT